MAAGLSVGQVARMLDVSTTRVQQFAAAGLLDFEQTALGRLFDAKSVRALAVERARKAAEGYRVKPPAIST